MIKGLRLVVVVELALIAVFAAWWGWSRTQSEPIVSPDERLCGPRSLHIAMNLLAEPVDFDQILETCTLQARGVAFGELLRLPHRRGMTAKLEKMTWDQLLSAETVCVLYVEPGHFIAIDSREHRQHDGKIRIYDPGQTARWVDRDQLDQKWRGETLVLGHSTSVRPITFDSCWQDAGLVMSDSHAYRVRISNHGDAAVDLAIKKSSCHCTVGSLGATSLEPGETTFCDVTVSLKGRRGPFHESVEISCSTQAEPTTLWFTGGKFPGALCRGHEFLGAVTPDEAFQKKIYVHDPGDGSLSLKGSDCDLVLRTAVTNEVVRCQLTLATIGEADADLGSRGLFQVNPGDVRVTVSGVIPRGVEPQSLKGSLKLTTRLPSPLNTIEVILSGQIVSHLKSSPPAVLVDLASPEPTANFVIQNTGKRRPKLIEYQFSGGSLGLDVKSVASGEGESEAGKRRPGDRDLVVTAMFRHSNRPSDLFNTPNIAVPATLTVRTTEGTVEIPILASHAENNFRNGTNTQELPIRTPLENVSTQY